MSEFEKITSQALSLPEKSRAELAELLIQSLDEKEDADIRAAWLQEIRRRDAEIRSGEQPYRSADEVLKDARKRLLCTE